MGCNSVNTPSSQLDSLLSASRVDPLSDIKWKFSGMWAPGFLQGPHSMAEGRDQHAWVSLAFARVGTACPLLQGSPTSPALSSFLSLVFSWELRVGPGTISACSFTSMHHSYRSREMGICSTTKQAAVCVSSLLIQPMSFFIIILKLSNYYVG